MEEQGQNLRITFPCDRSCARTRQDDLVQHLLITVKSITALTDATSATNIPQDQDQPK